MIELCYNIISSSGYGDVVLPQLKVDTCHFATFAIEYPFVSVYVS